MASSSDQSGGARLPGALAGALRSPQIVDPRLTIASARPSIHAGEGSQPTEVLAAMTRVLPRSLLFLAAHLLFIGTAIAVASLN